ncbi:MAG TPA: hypothetical protein VLS49_09925 [Usitatibacter sp.]|nr:hypothetical protein [Usitatibacter sp.]
MTPAPRVHDSATRLGAAEHDAVVACGSHGGVYAAWLAARAGVRAIVLNDAGIGLGRAGVAGIAWLDALGIAACAVDFLSARIGDGGDTLASGVLSTVNAAAERAGCAPGMACREALGLLARNAPPRAGAIDIPPIGESRHAITSTGHRPAWALDSVSLVRPEDGRAIVATGSHGALLGGKPDHVLEVAVHAAFFNDAGGGKDGAGYSRLPALGARGIAAATVGCESARIGEGLSTYETGVLSRVNGCARRLDLREGLTCREAVARLLGLG